MNMKEKEIPMSFEQWVREQRRRGLSNEEIRRIYWREFMERHPEQYGNAKERETHLNDMFSDKRQREVKELGRKIEEWRTLDTRTGGRLLKEIPELQSTIDNMVAGKKRWYGKKKVNELLKMANDVMDIIEQNSTTPNEYITMSVGEISRLISELKDHLELD
jgi:hypothetical protein